MRVALIDRARRRVGGGQDGIVAIVVALLLVVLLVITAFTVDFGLVYSTRSALQNSSDAAALGAASVYAENNLSCPNPIPVTFAAQDAAEDLRDANQAGSSIELITVECTPSGQVDVRYTSAANTPVILGGAAGIDEDYETSRTAVATVGVAESVPSGLRPFAICSAGIPDLVTYGGDLVVVDYDELVDSGECPQGQLDKDWWLVNCPSFPGAGSSNSALEDRVRDGCENEYWVVPGQAAFAGNPSALSSHLQDACASPNPNDLNRFCFGDVSGQAGAGVVVNAWASTFGELIVLPVLCGTVDPSGPACSPAAVVGDGTSAPRFPVHRFVGARVCAVRFVSSQASTDSGDCGGTATKVAEANAAGSERYMIMRFEPIQVASTIETSCSLGTQRCDGGVRTVALTE